MTGSAAEPSPVDAAISRTAYMEALRAFDAAVCEACAVSQAIGHRCAEPYAGYAANFFARVCGHLIAMIRALPQTRWVRSDFNHWDFSSVAGHTRAIAEGHLVFMYLAETPESKEQWSAKLNVMHLCDCARRISMFKNLDDEEQVKGFEGELLRLQEKLRNNSYFLGLPESVKKQCLNGRFLTIEDRKGLVNRIGYEERQFNAYFDLLSQHTHILTMSFYRMELEGRGAGIENPVDRSYMIGAMTFCTEVIKEEIGRLVELFPDVASARSGIDSKFSPGPFSNLPTWRLEQISGQKRIKKRKSKFRG